jgi:hypothetical protein
VGDVEGWRRRGFSLPVLCRRGASLVTGLLWGALQWHRRVPVVLHKASVGRKMRWSGTTTAGSEVRVAAKFNGIDGHRDTFYRAFRLEISRAS